MPINVMIADDEYFIRQRLKKIIAWEELDLHFVAEAENGLQVIDLLKAHKIDLIILDIKMPQMTGIQVAKYVAEHFPATKMIILSGYNDFEYARSAMQYRVSDYLLKPADQSALQDTLENCVQKIRQSRKQNTEIQKYHYYKKCTDLSKTLAGSLSLSELLLKYPEIKQNSYSLYIGGFVFHESEEIITNLVTQLRDLGWDCVYFKESDYTYTLQFFFKDKLDLLQLKTLLANFLSLQETYIFLSIGELFALDEDWRTYYKEAQYCLNQRYFSSSSTVQICSLAAPPKKYKRDLSKTRNTILHHLNSQDIEGFRSYIKSLFQDIQDKRNTDYLQVVVTEFFITYNIHYHHLIDFHHNITDFAALMIDEEYQLSELEDTIISYGLQCMTKNETAPSNVMLSEKIVVYIHDHYADPALTVTSLAECFELNASYIGSVFKKVKGQSVLQYITTVRMDASKKLLESNKYKVSDVSEMVGYTDAFYYSKRFKKMFGYSPRKYMLQFFNI